MVSWWKAIFYSFPIQLVLLHLKKFQLLLLFWVILFLAVGGQLMSAFGVDSLYLAPEYLGEVNALSTAMVGVSVGVFIMSWNITTFILFSRHFRFLATTTRPFLKYCINNAVIPLAFLLFYFIRAFQFDRYKELMPVNEILILSGGFLCGFVLIIAISLLYFFRADVSITRRMIAVKQIEPYLPHGVRPHIVLNSGGSRLIKVTSYLDTPTTSKPVRDVTHYSKSFIETVFGRHHFSAVVSILIALVFLVFVGFFMDRPSFQLPAAASITLFFSILVAAAGALSYFLQSWSIPFVIPLMIVLNFMYRQGWIDPSNKAYGLNYRSEQKAPYRASAVDSLCMVDDIERDKATTIEVLEKWKKRQGVEKPMLYLICVSGGGTRSATFTFHTLQALDSLSKGELMRQTFMITGASGGMLGAAYFRALYQAKQTDSTIDLQSQDYANYIAKDLLNPTFSSFVARDLFAPAQHFSVGAYEYVKDRGYAFEQALNRNTRWLMDKRLSDLAVPEKTASIPLMFFNSVITMDGRKLLMSTLPVSYMMRPANDSTRTGATDVDVIDYGALFAQQDPMNLRLLTALRMNATFPYVLPNVWLPSTPVIDAMDAGLRDNYGLETILRFSVVFKDWIDQNTAGVTIIQIRDRKTGGWEFPFETTNISELITKPVLLLQYNWYKMQQFNQSELLHYSEKIINQPVHKITFQYVPRKPDQAAALNFHLTKREKLDLQQALSNDFNRLSFRYYQQLLNNKDQGTNN